MNTSCFLCISKLSLDCRLNPNAIEFCWATSFTGRHVPSSRSHRLPLSDERQEQRILPQCRLCQPRHGGSHWSQQAVPGSTWRQHPGVLLRVAPRQGAAAGRADRRVRTLPHAPRARRRQPAGLPEINCETACGQAWNTALLMLWYVGQVCSQAF